MHSGHFGYAYYVCLLFLRLIPPPCTLRSCTYTHLVAVYVDSRLFLWVCITTTTFLRSFTQFDFDSAYYHPDLFTYYVTFAPPYCYRYVCGGCCVLPAFRFAFVRSRYSLILPFYHGYYRFTLQHSTTTTVYGARSFTFATPRYRSNTLRTYLTTFFRVPLRFVHHLRLICATTLPYVLRMRFTFWFVLVYGCFTLLVVGYVTRVRGFYCFYSVLLRFTTFTFYHYRPFAALCHVYYHTCVTRSSFGLRSYRSRSPATFYYVQFARSYTRFRCSIYHYVRYRSFIRYAVTFTFTFARYTTVATFFFFVWLRSFFPRSFTVLVLRCAFCLSPRFTTLVRSFSHIAPHAVAVYCGLFSAFFAFTVLVLPFVRSVPAAGWFYVHYLDTFTTCVRSLPATAARRCRFTTCVTFVLRSSAVCVFTFTATFTFFRSPRSVRSFIHHLLAYWFRTFWILAILHRTLRCLRYVLRFTLPSRSAFHATALQYCISATATTVCILFSLYHFTLRSTRYVLRSYYVLLSRFLPTCVTFDCSDLHTRFVPPTVCALPLRSLRSSPLSFCHRHTAVRLIFYVLHSVCGLPAGLRSTCLLPTTVRRFYHLPLRSLRTFCWLILLLL